jgi:hypothetical protein
MGQLELKYANSKFILVESTKKMFVGQMRKQIQKRVTQSQIFSD